MRLEGKVAIVTGAGRGIGKGAAKRFAAEGARVVVDDVNVETGEATVAEIVAAGGDAVFVRADVSDSDQVAELFARAEQAYGALDILMNNALCATQHVMDNDWQPQIDVIVKATYECSLAAIERMQPNGRGSIDNISSVNGLNPQPRNWAYGSAKGAVLTLTRGMATELAAHGIRVNAIAPGSIQSELPPNEAPAPVAMALLGRNGRPEEIASAALFLASDEASYITGQVLVVDGGALVNGHNIYPD